MTLVGPFFAVMSAVLFAAGDIAVRKGLIRGRPLTAAYTNVLVNLLIMWPLALLLTNPHEVTIQGVIIFALAGFMAPTLGRLFRFAGLNVIGVAKASPFSAIGPFFTAALAILFLHENLTLFILLGTSVMVLGVLYISLGEWAGPSRKGISIILLSTGFFSIAEILRKLGIEMISSPPLGVAIGSSVAFVTYLLYLGVTEQKLIPKDGFNKLFAISGVCTAFGLFSTFIALRESLVTLVVPIFDSAPLLAVIFSAFFLKDIEVVGKKVLISVTLVVVGGILLTS